MANECSKCHTKNPEDSKFCKECATSLPKIKEVTHTITLETPKEELTRGTIFTGRYEIIEELGKGGMGKVYRALDKQINEEVAIKFIKPEIASDKKTLERFSNELKLARKISHKYVCRMYHLEKEEKTPYITMEYVEGEDLKSVIKRKGELTINKAMSLVKQMCEGLAEAHRLGIIHRDLKPQNIMIETKGNVKIMDFGIARSVEAKGVTETGMIIGTPDYLSPEQAEGKEVDQRSDVYSLGVALYEMVTGSVPFRGDTALSVVVKHKTEIPPDPREFNDQVPEGLSAVILRCLEKKRERRYQAAEELLSDLDKIEKDIPFTAGELRSRGRTKEKVLEIKWKNSIAVLPFADLSPKKDQEYFCDGMAEELINALTQIKELCVVARTSAFSFKGKDLDIREIGQKLNVEKVLEGSVRKAANRLRITAQLVSVADGYQLWSEQYDRELSDVFVIQDEVTLAIADKLKVEIFGRDRASLTKRHTEDQEAYNLYLKGLYFLNKRTGEALKKSIEYFQKAVKNDPSYAPAYSGLADSQSVYGFYGSVSPKEVFPKAKTAVKKALEIDDTLAEAYASLGYINMMYDWDWAAAESRLKRAIELNPGYVTAHHYYAGCLAIVGRFDESISEMKRALELDPLSVRYHTELGNYFRWSGRLDEALEQLRTTLEMDPNFAIAHLHLGFVFALKERRKEAIAEFQKSLELTEGFPVIIGALGSTYAKLGEEDQAKKVLHDLEEMAEEKYVPPVSIAWIYDSLGKMDKALEWLEKGYEEHDSQMVLLNTWPEYEGLRSDSRVRLLLKKMGFK